MNLNCFGSEKFPKKADFSSEPSRIRETRIRQYIRVLR